jgi:hypothetical protein
MTSPHLRLTGASRAPIVGEGPVSSAERGAGCSENPTFFLFLRLWDGPATPSRAGLRSARFHRWRSRHCAGAGSARFSPCSHTGKLRQLGPIPIFVLIGALAAFGTHIGALQALGAIVTLIGVALVAARGDFTALIQLDFAIGDVFMLIACAAYAGYTLALRNRPAVPAFVFFAVLAGSALLVSIPLLLAEIAAGTVIWPTVTGWWILLYVAVYPSLLSQVFFMRGVELIGPGRAGLFVNLVPIFGALLAVLLLGEPFRAYHALALALVLGGIWLAEQGRG